MAYNFPRDNDAYPIYMPDGTEITSYDQGMAWNAAQDAAAAPTNNILGPNDETGYGSISDAAAQNGGFANRQAYIEYLYPGGTWLDSQRYQLPEGMTRDSGPVNPPVANWDPADEGLMKWMPYLIAGGAGLGLAAGAGAAGAAGAEGLAGAGAAEGSLAGAGTGASGIANYSTLGLGGGTGTALAGAGADAALLGGGAVNAATGLGEYSLASGVGGGLGGGATLGGAAALSPFSLGSPTASGAGSTAQTIGTGATTSNLGTAGTAAGAVAPGVLSRILNGTATADDWGKLLGSVAPGVLGYLGAGSTADAAKEIAAQARADRQPSLDYYNSLLTPQGIENYYKTPEVTGSVDAILRKLSMQGNPADNPGLLGQAAAYNLGGLTNARARAAGPAFGTAGSEMNVNLAGAQAGAGQYDAIGLGLSRMLNPQPSFEDTMKKYGLTIGGMRV